MENLLRHILDVSCRMAETQDLDQLLNDVMDQAIQLVGAERGYVILVQSSGELDFRARRGPGGQDLTDAEDQVSRSILRQVVEAGDPLVLRDATQDPRFGESESVVILRLRSVMCVPLISRGDLIGAIYVENRTIRGRFSQGDVAPLVLFANQAAVAIENARLFQAVQRSHDELEARVQERTTELSESNTLLKQEITERKRIEEALRESEERYRSLIEDVLDTSGVGFFILDADFRVVWVNRALELYFGLPREKIIGRDKRQFVREWIKNIFENPEYFAETVLATYDNNIYIEEFECHVLPNDIRQERWLEHRSQPIRSGFYAGGRVELYYDITARKQAEDLLRAQRDLGLALGATGDLGETLRLCLGTAIRVSGMDCGGVYLVNEITGGLNLAFHKGLPADFVARTSHYGADSASVSLVAAGKPIYTNYQELDAPIDDAKRREGLRALAIIPMLYEDQVIACLNVASHTLDEVPDFARTVLEAIATQAGSAIARSRTEAALAQSRANLQILFDSLEDFLFVLDMEGHIMDFNPIVLNRLGYSRVELLGEPVLKVHPPDRHEEAAAIVADMIAGQVDLCTVPLMAQDGTRIPVETRITRGHWDGQEALFGISRDITERQQAEEAIRQRNRELAELNAIIGTITSTLALEEVLQHIVAAVPRFFPHASDAIIRLLEETGTLSTWSASGKADDLGEEGAGWVLRERYPINVTDTTAESRFHFERDTPDYRSLLIVPLISRDQPLGTLSITSARVGAFSEQDERLLMGLSHYAAIAVQNARLYEQTRRDAEAKAMLLREVNHRVKNNLTGIIGLIDTERRYAAGEESAAVQAAMERLVQRIIGLAEIHDILSQVSWSPVSLSDLVRRIVSSTLNASPFDRLICVDVAASPIRVSPRQANNLALIVNELVTNTIKYTALEGEKAHIVVHIADEGEDTVLLEYRDDGPGYPEDVLRLEHHGVGMYLVRNLVHHALGGLLTLSNDDGAVTTIRFQVEEGSTT